MKRPFITIEQTYKRQDKNSSGARHNLTSLGLCKAVCGKHEHAERRSTTNQALLHDRHGRWNRCAVHQIPNEDFPNTVHPRLSGHVGQPFSKILAG